VFYSALLTHNLADENPRCFGGYALLLSFIAHATLNLPTHTTFLFSSSMSKSNFLAICPSIFHKRWVLYKPVSRYKCSTLSTPFVLVV
jgi:hypothetical protein